jgi:hypothetical protein
LRRHPLPPQQARRTRLVVKARCPLPVGPVVCLHLHPPPTRPRLPLRLEVLQVHQQLLLRHRLYLVPQPMVRVVPLPAACLLQEQQSQRHTRICFSLVLVQPPVQLPQLLPPTTVRQEAQRQRVRPDCLLHQNVPPRKDRTKRGAVAIPTLLKPRKSPGGPSQSMPVQRRRRLSILAPILLPFFLEACLRQLQQHPCRPRRQLPIPRQARPTALKLPLRRSHVGKLEHLQLQHQRLVIQLMPTAARLRPLHLDMHQHRPQLRP